MSTRLEELEELIKEKRQMIADMHFNGGTIWSVVEPLIKYEIEKHDLITEKN